MLNPEECSAALVESGVVQVDLAYPTPLLQVFLSRQVIGIVSLFAAVGQPFLRYALKPQALDLRVGHVTRKAER